MAEITPITANIENTKSHKSYREAKGAVKTTNNIKPLPPQGHLVHDRVMVMPKYFVKDIAYDLKSVKNGLNGTAKDHQTGKLNDVGLKLGGIGIATMLAAKTTNPVARIMEYAGLGAFLASMSLFPKIAIQAPSRAIHGFDTGIEYIDDQNRKKSMFQDSNYIPYDMYRGERKSEDLNVIGDRLGIPSDIHNREDLIKEQMRKIATQNNTLWMLTAGFATPVMTALICFGLERLIGPAVEMARNARYNSNISNILTQTKEMKIPVNEIESNDLSRSVEKFLDKYKNKELPKEELEKLTEIFTQNLDSKASDGIKADLENIFKGEKNGFALGQNGADDIINSIRNNLPNRNKAALEKVFVPSKEEINKILNSKEVITTEDLQLIKDELKVLFDGKIAAETGVSKAYLNAYKNQVIENISKTIQKTPSRYVSENTTKDVVNFAKILGDFKKNDKVLDKCKSFKFEYAPETVIARSYAKFEKTMLDVLGIKFKDLKQMKVSEKFTKEIVEKKLHELCADNAKYEKAVSKLSKVMSEMETNLHGKTGEGSQILDLINAIENNYNNTAKRLDAVGKDKFKNTIAKLVKEDVSTLSNSITTREEAFQLLDGTLENKADKLQGLDNVRANAKGVGSSKHDAITRIVERYQGAENSFRRILHTMDMFKRGIPESEYDKKVFEAGKETLLTATSSEHTLKLNTVNNPEFYKDIMERTFKEAGEETANAMGKTRDLSTGNILERFNQYIQRFKDIMGNNNIDFTKPEHKLDESVLNKYTKSARTRMAKFNLVSQNPVEMIKNAADRQYGTQKWFRIVSAIGAGVLGVTVLAQFAFGRIKNPHNLRKLVSDDDNK